MATDRRTEPSPGDIARLHRAILASPILQPIVARWDEIGLPDCWLAAGAIAQTVWNDAFGFDPCHGVKDIDLVYFDPADLSDRTEAENAARVRHLFRDLNVTFDVKNEARVHIWYAGRFGYEIEPYTSIAHAISTFPATATAIGVQPSGHGLSVIAPFGLDDLFDAVARPNKVQITREIYEAKVARWRDLWPLLEIVPW